MNLTLTEIVDAKREIQNEGRDPYLLLVPQLMRVHNAYVSSIEDKVVGLNIMTLNIGTLFNLTEGSTIHHFSGFSILSRDVPVPRNREAIKRQIGIALDCIEDLKKLI